MFIFIILSAIVAIGVSGYSIMPQYYFMLSGMVLAPLSVYFLSKGDRFHVLLGVVSILWQYVILRKGWTVSKTSIQAIVLNERLRQESEQHRQTKEKMEYLAHHDPLTGLPNRRYFHEWVEDILLGARQTKSRLGFLVVDLDNFKHINDTLGHHVGDAVLEQVAKRIDGVRGDHFATRMGGDEFCIVAENIGGRRELDLLAEKLLAEVCWQANLQGQEVSVAASVGSALFPDDGDDLRTVIQFADKAMYENKKDRKAGDS